jgi:hypothetical protein
VQLGRGHVNRIAAPLDAQVRQRQLEIVKQLRPELAPEARRLSVQVLAAWRRFRRESGLPELPREREVTTTSRESPVHLEFLADTNIARNTQVRGIAVGGLSAVTFFPDAGSPTEGILYALSDQRGPVHLFSFRLSLEDGALNLEPRDAEELLSPGGSFAPGTVDPEGLAILGTETIFSSEGDQRPTPRLAPAVFRLPKGGAPRSLVLPAAFLAPPEGPQDRGVRNNAAFEALAATPSEGFLFVGTEAALVQDGPESDFERSSRVRWIRYPLGAYSLGADDARADARPDARPDAQYAYELSAVPRRTGSPVRGSIGLVELLALSDTRLLALERATVENSPGSFQNHCALFEVNLESAVNVAEFDVLPPDVPTVPKRLVFDLDTIAERLTPPRLDNFEGMCFGPTLADGTRTLILVSDDNFDPAQRTAVLLLALRDEP